jgi:hypothetical protein
MKKPGRWAGFSVMASNGYLWFKLLREIANIRSHNRERQVLCWSS